MSKRSASRANKHKNPTYSRVHLGVRVFRIGAVALLGSVVAPPGVADETGREVAAPAMEIPSTSQANPVFEILGKLHARQRWLEGEIGRLQDQLAESASGFIVLQRDLRAKEAEVSALKGQLVVLEQANRGAEEARRRAAAQNARLSSALPLQGSEQNVAASDLQDRLMALKTRLRAMELEGDERRLLCAKLEQGRDQALSENLIIQAEKRELEGELERQTAARSELTRRIETLEVTLEAKDTEHEVLLREKSRLENALAQSGGDAVSMTRGLDGGRESSEGATEDKVHNIETLQKAGTDDADVEQVRRASLLRENSKLRESLAKAREDAADATQRLKVLEEIHAGAVAALERLQKDKAGLENGTKGPVKTDPQSNEKSPEAVE